MTKFPFLKIWLPEFALNKYNLNSAKTTFSVHPENDGFTFDIYLNTFLLPRRGKNELDYRRQNSPVQ